jgi:hypothetical protein
MSEAIKDCPFCGAKPEITQVNRQTMRIRCKNCLMGLQQKVLRYDLTWLEDKLIESWNMRYEPSDEQDYLGRS